MLSMLTQSWALSERSKSVICLKMHRTLISFISLKMEQLRKLPFEIWTTLSNQFFTLYFKMEISFHFWNPHKPFRQILERTRIMKNLKKLPDFLEEFPQFLNQIEPEVHLLCFLRNLYLPQRKVLNDRYGKQGKYIFAVYIFFSKLELVKEKSRPSFSQ